MHLILGSFTYVSIRLLGQFAKLELEHLVPVVLDLNGPESGQECDLAREIPFTSHLDSGRGGECPKNGE